MISACSGLRVHHYKCVPFLVLVFSKCHRVGTHVINCEGPHSIGCAYRVRTLTVELPHFVLINGHAPHKFRWVVSTQRFSLLCRRHSHVLHYRKLWQWWWRGYLPWPAGSLSLRGPRDFRLRYILPYSFKEIQVAKGADWRLRVSLLVDFFPVCIMLIFPLSFAKYFGSGVIVSFLVYVSWFSSPSVQVATAFIHLLSPAISELGSSCLSAAWQVYVRLNTIVSSIYSQQIHDASHIPLRSQCSVFIRSLL